MELKEFNYNGSHREVIVTETDAESIKGYDISKLDKVEQRVVWRELAQKTDLKELSEEQIKKELSRFKELQFRHFKKNKIEN